MAKALNVITNVIAYLVKNVNMLVGLVANIAKVVVAIINIFAPSKDGLVDKITAISEKIQTALFKASEFLKNFGSSTE